MMDSERKNKFGFPSEFVSVKTKVSPEYMLAYSRAFDEQARHGLTDSLAFAFDKNFLRYKKYAKGEQSRDQYKELTGIKRGEGGGFNPSYRNLNWDIFKVLPKLLNVLEGRLLNTIFDVGLSMIDPKGVSDRKEQRIELETYLSTKEEIENFESITGSTIERPQSKNGILPENEDEIDAFMEANPRESLPEEVQDIINWVLDLNNYQTIEEEVIIDLTELGYAGICRSFSEDGFIRLRKADVDRTVMNKCKKLDFSDLFRIGEYYEITVGELRQRTKGQWKEHVYKEIANKYTANKGTGNYAGLSSDYYNENTGTYRYDHEKITIFEYRFLSTDYSTYVSKEDKNNNHRLAKKSWNWTGKVDNKDLTDSEYEKGTGNRVMRVEGQNAYQCSWIVGSPYVFDYGILQHMDREINRSAETNLGWSFSTTNFQSTVARVENVVDNLQLNWLQFQAHIAASKPAGVAIEFTSLVKASKHIKGTSSNNRIDPKEMLLLYAETGNIVFNGYDQKGNPLPWFPITELKGGISDAAFKHYEICVEMIDLLRTLMGINPVVEGQAPEPRQGMTVSMMAVDASDNAITYIRKAYKRLHEGIIKGIIRMIPGLVDRVDSSILESVIGSASVDLMKLQKSISLRQMGVTVEEIDKDKLLTMLHQTLAEATSAGYIGPEEKAEILLIAEKNPYRVIPMLKKKKREASEMAKESEQAKNQLLIQTEQAKIQAAGQVELQKIKQQADLEMRNENAASNNRIRESVIVGAMQIRVAEIHKEATEGTSETSMVSSITTKLIDKFAGGSSGSTTGQNSNSDSQTPSQQETEQPQEAATN